MASDKRKDLVELNATTITATSVQLSPQVRQAFRDGYKDDPEYADLNDGDSAETAAGTLYRDEGLVF
jgi:hypothetical protein